MKTAAERSMVKWYRDRWVYFSSWGRTRSTWLYLQQNRGGESL